MKNTIIILIALSFVLIACSDSTGPAEPKLKIKGSVENWNGGKKNISLELYSPLTGQYRKICTGNILEDRSFNLEYNEDNVNPENDLKIVQPSGNECINDISITPSGIKYSDMFIAVEDTSGKVIGFLEHRNFNDAVIPGSFSTWYAYSGGEGNVNGSINCAGQNDTTHLKYDIKLKKGWNQITGTFDEYSQTRITYSYSTTSPSGGKWYFYTWEEMKLGKFNKLSAN